MAELNRRSLRGTVVWVLADNANAIKFYENAGGRKIAEGKETFDGHPTQKTRAVLTGKNKERKEYLVWYATDLQDFPVKLQMTEGPSTMVMTFRNLKQTAPETSQFEAPSGYTKQPSIEQQSRAR